MKTDTKPESAIQDFAETERRVGEALACVLGTTFIAGSVLRRQAEARWDSLRHMEIIFAIEDEFGVRFTEQEMAEMDSSRKLAEKVFAEHASRD